MTRLNAVILTLRMLNLKLHGLKLKTKEARILYVVMFIDIHTIIVRIFFNYLEECLTNLTKKNKEVYICGDFNFDLLKVDTDNITQYFFNLLCSYGFLPHILQPTRVTEHTATVIDNIFSNNLQDDILSGTHKV